MTKILSCLWIKTSCFSAICFSIILKIALYLSFLHCLQKTMRYDFATISVTLRTKIFIFVLLLCLLECKQLVLPRNLMEQVLELNFICIASVVGVPLQAIGWEIRVQERSIISWEIPISTYISQESAGVSQWQTGPTRIDFVLYATQRCGGSLWISCLKSTSSG